MAVSDRKHIRRLAAALLTGVSVCVLGVSATTVQAQSMVPAAADGAKLLLRANELVYNQDAKLVTATGGVQLYYNRYKMVAQRVQYDQKSGRVMATGNIEPDRAGRHPRLCGPLDITDDFGEGFLNALRVETTDNTRLAAESAERQPGDLMVLNNSVYSACLPCAQTPGKAPLWQVKAQRVVRNGQAHTIVWKTPSSNCSACRSATCPSRSKCRTRRSSASRAFSSRSSARATISASA